MNKPTSSTIEDTTKDNQNHRSQVIAKGRRQLQRTSSRPRSAKERQDALEKIIQFRKKTKTPKKKFSKKVIYIKEKKQKEEKTSKYIQTSNKNQSKIQKQEKKIKENNDTKAKESTQLKSVKEEEETNELESTTLFSFSKDHHHEEKAEDQNGTTSNTNSLSASFTDDVISPKTTKIHKIKHQHASTNNACTKSKDTEKNNEVESTTSFSFSKDHHNEENTTEKNGTTSNSNFLSASFNEDVISPKTSKIHKIKNQHASTNNDCTTEKNIKENNKIKSSTATSFSFSKDDHHEEKSSEKHGTITTTGSLQVSFSDDVFSPKKFKKITTRKRKHKHASTNKNCTTTKNHFSETDDFTCTDSTCTDTTEMTSGNNLIDVAPELNELNIKNTEKKPKKKCCSCCSIIFTIIGFVILLFTAYYFGTNMLEEKCKQDIGNYVKNLSIKNISVEKYFEAFKEQNTNTYCKWIWKSKQKIIFGEKIEGKYKEKIDKFFEQYAKQQTMEHLGQLANLTKKERDTTMFNEKEFFLQNQKFYEDEIDYKPLTKYYQQKKKELEGNKELMPTYIEISGFKGDYKELDGKYELSCYKIRGLLKIEYENTRHNDGKFIVKNIGDPEWYLALGYSGTEVFWLKTDIKNNPHPGTFGAQKPVTSDRKTPIDNIEITTKLFPEQES